MSVLTVVFLVIGGFGVLLFVLSLLGVELFDFDGLVPMEVVAAALGTFGFAAAIASSALDARGWPALLVTTGIGVGAAIPAGWLTLRLTLAAQRMSTDATPTREDLPGLLATVVSTIPAGGYGEIRVTLGGQPVKLYATADATIPAGTEVFIIATRSETSVVVEQLTIPPLQS